MVDLPHCHFCIDIDTESPYELDCHTLIWLTMQFVSLHFNTFMISGSDFNSAELAFLHVSRTFCTFIIQIRSKSSLTTQLHTAQSIFR